MTELPAHAVGRRWVHSHEEDTEHEMVFRPAEREFPPSRGRMRFELLPDGKFVESAPGPTDAPEKRTGTWKQVEGKLMLDSDQAPEGRRELEIISADEDRLVVKK